MQGSKRRLLLDAVALLHNDRQNEASLALSGDGFRATMYHLGALIRLNELGVLTQIERISSASGGSIIAGVLSKAWQILKVKDGIIPNFDEKVTTPIRKFCASAPRVI